MFHIILNDKQIVYSFNLKNAVQIKINSLVRTYRKANLKMIEDNPKGTFVLKEYDITTRISAA